MQVCRRLVSERGLSALNMRTVAKECGTALGTLYNYYSDKDELVIATIAVIWQDIFHLPREESGVPFTEYVDRLFRRVREVSSDYPDFFAAHSAAVAGAGSDKAKSAMDRCFEDIRHALLAALKSDSAISPSAFSGALSEEAFAEFVLENIILLLSADKPSCSALTEIISRTIYTDR